MKNNLKNLRHQINTNKGFTLIEVLIALVLMSILMTAIYSFVDTSLKTKERVISEDREYLEVFTALTRIERDLSQYYNPRYHSSLPGAQAPGASAAPGSTPPPQVNTPVPGQSTPNAGPQNVMPQNQNFPTVTEKGHPIPLFDRVDNDEIIFMTSGHKRFIQGQKQSRYAWIRYYLRDPDETPEGETPPVEGTKHLYRQIISENIYDPNFDITKERETLILRGIEKLTFFYWDTVKKKWLDTYEFGKKPPPLAFMIRIEWIDSKEGKSTFEKTIRPYWPNFNPDEDKIVPPTTGSAPAQGDAQ